MRVKNRCPYRAEFRIESSCGERCVSLPECARLMQKESSVEVPPAQKGSIAVFLNHLVFGIDSVQVPVDDIRTFVFSELDGYALQCPGM